MPLYNVEFSYDVPEWGVISIEADNPRDAEELALKELYGQGYEEEKNFQIDSVVEQKLNG